MKTDRISKISAVSALLLLISAPSFAHWHSGGWYDETPCFPTSETRVDRLAWQSNECQQVDALNRVRVKQTYPAMGGTTLEVDAWEGSYSRPAKVRVTTTYFDSFCRVQIIHEVRDLYPIYFDIENPNLKEDVSVSFVANSPMTRAEAVAAMAQTKTRCERAQ